MALDTFVVGRYAGTYNAVDVGITENGYETTLELKQENIDESDAYGAALLDYVYRGGNCSLEFDSKAYKAGSKTPFWPWGAWGGMATTAAPIGRLASAVASAMVLTAAANTPAAAAPATLTASKAILSPGFSGKLLYNSKLRRVPVKLCMLPSDSTGTVTWFAET